VKKSEVSKLVMMLMAAFPASKTNDSTSAVYEEMLLDLDVDLARVAVTRLLVTAKWMPTIAEIRAASTDLRLGPVRDGGEAWKDAMAAARYVGRYGVPKIRDPLVREALRMWGSWQSFCDSPEDDPGGRARFIELYDSLTRRKRDTDVSGIPLPAAERPRPRLVPPIAPAGLAPAPAPVAPVVPIAPPVAAPAAPAPGEPVVPVPLPMMPMVPRKRHPDPPYRRYTAEELEAALKKPPGGTDGQRTDDQAGGAAK
jgi:hypothetical protein